MSSPRRLISEASVRGCFRLEGNLFEDPRGSFHKVFSPEVVAVLPGQMVIREMFWSESKLGVIRGMHFQLPPKAVRKLVWVSKGVISDVILDLRQDSPTYLQSTCFELSCSSGAVYIPIGCAHGFEVLSDSAVVNYAQDGGFDPELDSGIHWNSFGHEWRTSNPVISQRDAQLTSLDQFRSPFSLQES